MMELPTVLLYKVSPITYGIGKMVVNLTHVGLPNIVAGKEVIPELLQDDGIDMIEDHVEGGGKQFNSQDLLTICMWIGLALWHWYHRKCRFIYLNSITCIHWLYDLCSHHS